MRALKRILAGMCMAAVMMTIFTPSELKASELKAPRGIEITAEETTVPVLGPGETKIWKFTIHNGNEQAANNVVIIPKLGGSGAWPFVEACQEVNIEKIDPDGSASVEYIFTQRDDAPTAVHKIQFDVYANGEAELMASQNFYIKTTEKEKEEKPLPFPDNSGNNVNGSDSVNGDNSDNNDNSTDDMTDAGQQPGEPPIVSDGSSDYMMADAGGFSNGGVISGGGSNSGSVSVPRVIVTGFSTDPVEVRAGSNFALIIHLKNTSKATAVRNMLFDLNAPTEGSDEQSVAPAFLPASGSSSIYLDGIKANGTADISIQLNAKADLLQKPYSVDLSMKYEDAEGSQIEASSSISIPIKQDARFEFSDFEISPESISVGDEANVMCNLYNLGRIKLYNVKAAFEGSCIKKEEVFLGNVESGASASIDAMLEGAEATEGPAKVKMTVSYEDEAGKIAVVEKELELEVTEAMESDMMTGGMEMIEEEQKGFPVLPAAVLGAVILIIIIIVVVIKRRKKRQRMNEEEGLLDELDRPSEDER